MKLPSSDDIQTAEINLEVNFEARGGLQRFRTLQDLFRWIAEERSFWRWLEPHHHELGGAGGEFWRFESDIQDDVNRATQQWQRLVRERSQLGERILDKTVSEDDKQNIENRLTELETEFDTILDQLARGLRSHLHSAVLERKSYLLQGEPEARFVAEISGNSQMLWMAA